MSFQKNPLGIRYGNDDGGPELLKELNSRLAVHFKRTGTYANSVFWLKALFWFTAAGLFWWEFVSGGSNPWISFLWAVSSGLCCLFFLLNVGHDAAHKAVFRSPGWNVGLQWLSFSLLGVSSYLWEIRHNHSHHLFPNVNGCDADIDENPFFRFSPNQPRLRRHRHQHLYAPFVYSLVHIHLLLLQDFSYLFKTELANLVAIHHRKRDVMSVLAAKFLFLLLWIVLPVSMLPYTWWQILLMVLGMSAVVSQFFVLPLVGTHFNDVACFPELDGDNRLPWSFFMHQVATSLDWSVKSRLARSCYGGINFHLIHHLYPAVNHIHFTSGNLVLYDFLAEREISHHSTTLWGAIGSHFRFLRGMGRDAWMDVGGRASRTRCSRICHPSKSTADDSLGPEGRVNGG